MPTAIAAGIKPRRLAHEIGVLQRRRADDDARDALLQPAATVRRSRTPPPSCTFMPVPARMRSTAARVHRLPGEGAVEIDDVQIVETLALELSRLRGGVGVEDRRLLHVAAHEAHAFAVLQVDRGEQDHGRHFRKLAISARPRVWLFSGWNCVPATLSRATIAVIGPP